MSASTNAAENMPIADPVPLEEEAEDIEAIARLLEAAKAKKIRLRKGRKSVRRRNRSQTRPRPRRRLMRAEAKRVQDVEEARKRKVSLAFFLVVSG